ncbi:MAG: NHLP bacteriocin system secretion protein [Gemmatimonadales bacterium]
MSQIFRKVSLDRLASPEQLDQLMRVTDSRGWIALAGIALVLLTGVVWGWLGRLPERVVGQGMLVRSGGVLQVIPSAGGRVVDVAVGVGDHVTEGQVVARVEQPGLADRLRSARATLANLQEAGRVAAMYGRRDSDLRGTILAQQRANLERAITAAREDLGWLGEKITSQERLVAEGLLTRTTLLGTRQQYEATRSRIAESENQLTQLAQQGLALQNQAEGDAIAAGFRLREAAAQVEQLERELNESSRVTAPATGRILELLTERGSLVAPGEPILALDLVGKEVKDLEAVLYVPAIHGKQIRPGMTIQIAPSTVKQEEYGLMLGRVTYVSDFPATSKGMMRVLKNDKLVSALSGGGAPYEVHADLIVDPTTVSQYRWSSSQGPPVKIESGTLAMGNIVVSSKRPLEMVIPLVRKSTGL